MNKDYDRYQSLKVGGEYKMKPFISLKKRSTDIYIKWKVDDRLDKIAYKYYDNVFFDFLIFYANPKYTNYFDFEPGKIIRIPFPLSDVLVEYETKLKKIINGEYNI